MICPSCNGPAIENQALNKKFYYCRECKIEVDEHAFEDPYDTMDADMVAWLSDLDSKIIIDDWDSSFTAFKCPDILLQSPNTPHKCPDCGNFTRDLITLLPKPCGCKK